MERDRQIKLFTGAIMVARVEGVLRYPGGKSKAIKFILPMIPQDIKEYREPFVGGGSVFISAKQKLGNNVRYTINDLNIDLYSFWKVLKEQPNQFIEEIAFIKRNFNSGKYLYNYYKSNNINWTEFHRAVRFFVLNRITFSGLVESGGYSQESYEKRFTDSLFEKLKKLSLFLDEVDIQNRDYSYLIKEPGEDVFIFLDPPYFCSRESKLYGKNGDLHTDFDHLKFACTIKKCKHKWLITCDDSLFIRNLFSSFANIYPWDAYYSMTSINKDSSKKGKQIFICNYKIEDYKTIID